eukprot:8502320-Pyramimonas_sp.AAC.1
MGTGAGCRTLGDAPVRAGTPIRQHAPMALSDPPMGMGGWKSVGAVGVCSRLGVPARTGAPLGVRQPGPIPIAPSSPCSS